MCVEVSHALTPVIIVDTCVLDQWRTGLICILIKGYHSMCVELASRASPPSHVNRMILYRLAVYIP